MRGGGEICKKAARIDERRALKKGGGSKERGNLGTYEQRSLEMVGLVSGVDDQQTFDRGERTGRSS